jgi:hypothetical protein
MCKFKTNINYRLIHTKQTYSLCNHNKFIIFNRKENNKEVIGTEFDMKWKIRIYKQMELTLAHEVKGFKLTNSKKHIHLLCDNELTMPFNCYVINISLILNGYSWRI